MSLFAVEARAEGLRVLTRDRARAAVFCGIDGTLAPVVDRADDAQSPRAVSRLLGALGRRCARVARVSGSPRLSAAFGQWQGPVRRFAAGRPGSAVRVGVRSAEGPRDTVIGASLLAGGAEGFAGALEGLLRAAR